MPLGVAIVALVVRIALLGWRQPLPRRTPDGEGVGAGVGQGVAEGAGVAAAEDAAGATRAVGVGG